LLLKLAYWLKFICNDRAKQFELYFIRMSWVVKQNKSQQNGELARKPQRNRMEHLNRHIGLCNLIIQDNRLSNHVVIFFSASIC